MAWQMRLRLWGRNWMMLLGMAPELYNTGYKWSGYIHPETGINVKSASKGDMYILEQFNQTQSVILDSQGNFNIFEIGE